ncbi:hypothetical protein TNIN_88981 [Trichonephila inaurata madagascariensis]|uniref:Uncharacterized protein n=1 Tax=Trichonephila inaurata madagascariensis TaxID=2747483 RepID=A0A8X6YZU0_9ARAC|nr:hypothetical protein TNIN_88981 [Trichonephila inaurata madagascariensis]
MSANGLEYTFAVDLINFVMEHRKMDWKFHKYFMRNIQSTPLTPTIRSFVLQYLEKEETNIYFLYMMVTKASKVDCDRFYYVVEYVRSNIFSNVNTVTEVIRYCILISQYSLLAYQSGAHLAPLIALKEIPEALKTFISEKTETSSAFWTSLDSEVSKLLPESFASSTLIDSPIKQEKFLQEQTSDLDESLQEQREQSQSPPEQILEAYLKDEEANTPDERKNLNLIRLQTNNTLQNEEERLLIQTKIQENQQQQKIPLQKYNQYGEPKDQSEKTDLSLQCEKEKNQSQQGLITPKNQKQEKIQVSGDQQLLKIEVVKDLLQERTPPVRSQPQIPDQLQQNKTLSKTAVQQDQSQEGKESDGFRARTYDLTTPVTVVLQI